MLPGPDSIYKCPHCENLLKRGSLMSGNTLNSKLYSDGKRVAPMLPDFPNLTKCEKCNNIFWLSNLEEIGGYSKWHDSRIDERFKTEDMKSKWEMADEVAFLGVEDLCRALTVAKDAKEEKAIRIWIWWTFNDRIRGGGDTLFVETNDKGLWEENCKALIKILDDTDFNEKLMIADLYRNLGEFNNCIDIIDSIDQDDVNWLKDPMEYLARKNISRVFAFQLFNLPKGKNKLPFFQVRGELREKQGDYQGALDDYEKAIFLNDSIPFLYLLKAGAYEKLGKSKMALESFDKALFFNPEYADAYINRSLFFRRRKKFKDAKKDYDKALSLEPRSFEITTFSEIDIFRYGRFKNIINKQHAKTFDMLFREGTLYVDVRFCPYKKVDADSSLFINGKNLPYFFFRRKRWKPIMSERFVKFEFTLAKCISFIRISLLRKPLKYIDDAVLN